MSRHDVRMTFVARRELMQFEILMKGLKDAANDPRKTGRRDGVADD